MAKLDGLGAKDVKIEAVSEGPSHHFFGFHDLIQSNAKGDLLLGLEADIINRPPLPGEKIRSGVISPTTRIFETIHETCAFNYPQGARQQWVGESDNFVCNDMVGDEWGSHLSDARSKKVIETFQFPVHCLKSCSGDAFYPDYRRLHFVGGYGYIGLPDLYPNDDIPSKTGIFKANLRTKENDLLVSISDVAQCGSDYPVKTGYSHYLTHLLLNPSKTRLAFLHRYRVSDGGETTRLMSIGVDGRNLRCLAKGFLSHFDWLDDENIFIWGVHQGYGLSLREKRIVALPGVSLAVQIAKKVYRGLKGIKGVQVAMKQNKSFLSISDSAKPVINKIAIGVLSVDGHPMVCPVDRNWIVNDTYPDNAGFRTLMMYNIENNSRIDLGCFKMSDEKPNEESMDCDLLRQGLDARVQRKYPLSNYLFFRSGLHCDLHPRWSYDCNYVLFDSIHEGHRQIYRADVSKLLM